MSWYEKSRIYCHSRKLHVISKRNLFITNLKLSHTISYLTWRYTFGAARSLAFLIKISSQHDFGIFATVLCSFAKVFCCKFIDLGWSNPRCCDTRGIGISSPDQNKLANRVYCDRDNAVTCCWLHSQAVPDPRFANSTPAVISCTGINPALN